MNRTLKYITLTVVLLLTHNNIFALNIKSVWLSLPEELIPYISKATRQDMLNKNEMTSTLSEPCRIDTITDTFISATLSTVENLQIKLLKREQGDTIVYLINTLSAPEKESKIRAFEINKDENSNLILHDTPINLKSPSLPDSSTIISYSLFSDNDNLEISLNPIYELKEIEDLKTENTKKLRFILKWNGKTFN